MFVTSIKNALVALLVLALTACGGDKIIDPTAQFTFPSVYTTKTFGDSPFFLIATGSAQVGVVAYSSSNTDVATIDRSTGLVTIIKAGETTVTAELVDAAGTNVRFAMAQTQLVISKNPQDGFSIGSNLTRSVNDMPFRLNVSGKRTSGIVTYSSSDNNIATIDAAGTVTLSGVSGQTIIRAIAPGDDNHLAADSSIVLTVNDLPAGRLSIGTVTVAKKFGDAPFIQAARIRNGAINSISYTSSETTVATIHRTTGEVIIQGIGRTVITANARVTIGGRAEDQSASYTLIVAKGEQTAITFTHPAPSIVGTKDATFQLVANGGSGTGVVSYESSNTAIATVDNTGIVTIVANRITATLVRITATKAADRRYNAVSGSYNLRVLHSPPILSSAPQNSYALPINRPLNTIYFPNTGGIPLTRCTINPPLPDGLTVGITYSHGCAIIGTPRENKAATDYIVTATNSSGNGTVVVNLAIPLIAPNIQDVVMTYIKVAGTDEYVPSAGPEYFHFSHLGTQLVKNVGGAPERCVLSSDVNDLLFGIIPGSYNCGFIGGHYAGTITLGASRVVTIENAIGVDTARLTFSAIVNTDNVARGTRGTPDRWDPESVAMITVGNTPFAVVTGSYDDSISAFHLTDAGSLIATDSIRDGERGATKLNGATSITTITVGDTPFILVVGYHDNGVSVFRITDAGQLITTDNIGDGERGATELNDAKSVNTITIGSTPFALVAGFADGVSVFRITDAGSLITTDNIEDGERGATELNDALSVATITVGDTPFILVAGYRDYGVSVFRLSKAGSLIVTDNLGDGERGATALDGAIVTTTTIGSTSFALVAGHNEHGVSVFRISKAGSLITTDNIRDGERGATELRNPRVAATTVVNDTPLALIAGFDDTGISVLPITHAGSLVAAVANIHGNGSLQDVLKIWPPRSIASYTIGNTVFVLVTGFYGISVFQLSE